MEFCFYIFSSVAIVATLGVVTCLNPVHALLDLLISLISIAMVFFTLGANFAGVLEILVYAGAIMVLFVFVVMMLNMGMGQGQERCWFAPQILVMVLVLVLVPVVLLRFSKCRVLQVGKKSTDMDMVGGCLFGPYLLLVELSAFLLLAALITASHVGR